MHANQKKGRKNDVCWRLILFYSGTCCIPLVLWLSIATFNDAKPRLKVVSWMFSQRICCKLAWVSGLPKELGERRFKIRLVVNTNPTWARRVTPPWNTYVAKYDPRWEGYTDWQTGGSLCTDVPPPDFFWGSGDVCTQANFWPVRRLGSSWNFKVLKWINLNERFRHYYIHYEDYGIWF